MNRSTLLPLCLLALSAAGQWSVPVGVVLDGPDPAMRRVTGLADPADGTDGTSARTERTRALLFVTATGVNSLALTLPGGSQPVEGQVVEVVPSAINTAAVTLSVNGGPALPVVKGTSLPLDSADLRPGQPVVLVHDGQAYQLTSQVMPACPAGMVRISRDACIDAQASGPLNFFQASHTCRDRQARLCTFTEWYTACARIDGFFATVANYEWIDHAANDIDKAKRIGLNEQTLAPDCKGGSHSVPSGLTHFRCCSDR